MASKDNNKVDNIDIANNVVKRSNKANNMHPVTMSISETDPEKAKAKAELFNKLNMLRNKRGIAKFNSTEEMQICIEQYFTDCAELGLRPTISGLANSLGTDFRTLIDWEQGSRDGTLGSSCSQLIKNAKAFVREFDELSALEGLDNPILFMFRAKNYYGMSDKQEIEISPKNNNMSDKDVDSIAKEYTAQAIEQKPDTDF